MTQNTYWDQDQVRVAIVIPSVRKNQVKRFLDCWREHFEKQLIFLVEDNPEKTFQLSAPNVLHYSWSEIDKELGADSWIIPRSTDCIRSFGIYKAANYDVQMIVTLDDDCLPLEGSFLPLHHSNLTHPVEQEAWVATGQGIRPRGMPYRNRARLARCVISHGLWDGVPDLDAITQLVGPRVSQTFTPLDQVIPRGLYFPMCGMNLAFEVSMVPAMYFLLMGKDWPFDRFGDIWCGLLAKKICDHLGLGVRSGSPRVLHERASDVWANLRKESAGYEVNERFWQAVDSVILTGTTVAECYRELADHLPMEGQYWDRVRAAMRIWAELTSASARRTHAETRRDRDTPGLLRPALAQGSS